MDGPTDTVTVRLVAGLDQRSRDGRSRCALDVAAAPTVRDVWALSGLADGSTGIVPVNGLHARDDETRRAGAEVSLFPPRGGG
jgi:hypothetical protein